MAAWLDYRNGRVAKAALFVVGCLLVAAASGQARADNMRREIIVLNTQGGQTEIAAEIALSQPEQQLGLMFRTGMGDNEGMLFVYAQPQDLAMWMHNTYLALDMVFIRGNGTVARIEANAQPLSDRVIASGGAVRAVLELKAGTAQRLGLKAGDRVESPSLHAAVP